MLDPILLIHLPIQRRTLNINRLILPIESQIPNRRRLRRDPILDTHLREIRRRDEIHILSRHGPQSHHSQRGERAHGAGVVITGQTISGSVEL